MPRLTDKTRMIGGRPFGYVDGRGRKRLSAEQQAIARMLAMDHAGVSHEDIVAHFKHEGFPVTHGIVEHVVSMFPRHVGEPDIWMWSSTKGDHITARVHGGGVERRIGGGRKIHDWLVSQKSLLLRIDPQPYERQRSFWVFPSEQTRVLIPMFWPLDPDF